MRKKQQRLIKLPNGEIVEQNEKNFEEADRQLAELAKKKEEAEKAAAKKAAAKKAAAEKAAAEKAAAEKAALQADNKQENS